MIEEVERPPFSLVLRKLIDKVSCKLIFYGVSKGGKNMIPYDINSQ
uniref:Uncharacterized protein n=1 Tax=Siphoviridae sp. ctAUQ2 TaxID=2826182 RepID=A0A8S5MYT5_9CAUD|nr:MAG TPA: hypothetical protein [Siphoviridae sp. ctAUQ2]